MSSQETGTGSAEPPDPAASPVGKVSRAGRNLPMALAVGLGLGAVIIASLLTYRQTFLIIIVAAVVASIWELQHTLRVARGIEISWLPVALGSIATVVLAWPYGHDAQALGVAFTALACMAWRFGRGSAGYLADVSASIFVTVYLGLLASFAAMMLAPSDGAHRIMAFLIMVVASDTGGYAGGVLFGKHPMAPAISPKKSWEGFAGSVLAAMVGGALTVWLLLGGQWWQGALVGAVLAVTATAGDLAESLIKRDLGVKDMGNLLPGHGGIMDRMDSLLPSAIFAWLLLAVFVPVP
jgi:phosphatidate cytidylyltransferase